MILGPNHGYLVEPVPNTQQYVPIYKDSIMTAPHHGSDDTSGTRENTVYFNFINRVLPKAILISAGYNNEFKLPGNNFVRISRDHLQSRQTKVDMHYIYYNKTNDRENGWRLFGTDSPLYANVQADAVNGVYFCTHQFHGMAYQTMDLISLPSEILFGENVLIEDPSV